MYYYFEMTSSNYISNTQLGLQPPATNRYNKKCSQKNSTTPDCKASQCRSFQLHVPGTRLTRSWRLLTEHCTTATHFEKCLH